MSKTDVPHRDLVIFFLSLAGAFNNAGLVPLSNVIAPGLPAPPPYTPSHVGAGKAGILFMNLVMLQSNQGKGERPCIWLGPESL